MKGIKFNVVFYRGNEKKVEKNIDIWRLMEYVEIQNKYGWYVEEFLEYTGVKDKKGKEIYEGDIAILDNVSTDNPMIMMRNISRFNFVPIKRFKEFPQRSGYYSAEYACEVIGNRYENPELLEEENEA